MTMLLFIFEKSPALCHTTLAKMELLFFIFTIMASDACDVEVVNLCSWNMPKSDSGVSGFTLEERRSNLTGSSGNISNETGKINQSRMRSLCHPVTES